MLERSKALFEEAKACIPGGVNSPVRAFNGVGGTPVFMERAEGAYLFDADGNRYIDYIGSWGPAIVGHAHPTVLDAIRKQMENGLSFGTPTALESRLAQKVRELMPMAERVRMVSSGTEAAMSAIRLARGYTGRDVIIKFEGCYHGHADSLLVKAGSGALTLGVPTSPGVPAELAKLTLTLDFNNIDQVAAVMADVGKSVAAIIVEPIAGNMNCIPPRPGFLEGLRELCTRHGSVLILDEVMTGFRVHTGGAQALYGIRPDITVLGKIIGGGLPVGAFAGSEQIMSRLAPSGPVYQAGTLSGSPLAMASGLATLELVSAPGFHARLAERTDQLVTGLKAAAGEAGIPLAVNQVPGMFGFFFTDAERVETCADAQACDLPRFKAFFHAMLDLGVYLAPSAFEAGFLSSAHTSEVIKATLDAAGAAFGRLKA